jgi:TRAP-type C4-dicarboxylate transport system permease small subunit
VDGRFIVVNILVDRFPKKLNLIIEVLMGVLSLAFFLLVGIQLFRQIEGAIAHGESYFMIGVPKWPMYAALGASFLACIPATIVYVDDRIVNFKDPKKKTVFDENPDLAILAFADEDHTETGGAD